MSETAKAGRRRAVRAVREERRRQRKQGKEGAEPPVGDRAYRGYVGPGRRYDVMGASQFRLLCALGLRENHRVLDIGCGSLRAGRLLLPYLLPERYYGVEPNRWLVAEGMNKELGADIARIKQPSFHYSDAFDFEVFGVKFDYIVAQSIFSHTGSDLLRTALTSAARVMHEGTKFVATFMLTSERRRSRDDPGWRYPDCVVFEPETVEGFIREAGLFSQYLPWHHPSLDWYLITSDPAGLVPAEDVGKLHGLMFFNGEPRTPRSRPVRMPR